MALPETWRQILAGALAAGAFLALYEGAAFAWWAALGLALAVYVALLLILRRAPPEAPAAEGVSRRDLDDAVAALEQASGRLGAAAQTTTGAASAALGRLATGVAAIARHYRADPRDFRQTRRFVKAELPELVAAAEAYVALAGKARGAQAERLAALAAGLEDFAQAVERIEQACLDNDFLAFEVQMDVLSDRLGKERTRA